MRAGCEVFGSAPTPSRIATMGISLAPTRYSFLKPTHPLTNSRISPKKLDK